MVKYLFTLLGLACIGWLVLSFDVSLVLQIWLTLGSKLIISVVALEAIIIVFKFFRWHYLLQRSLGAIEGFSSLSIFGQSLFWGQISPGNVGAIVMKCHLIRKRYGHPYATTALIVIVDHLYDVMLLAVSLALGWLYVTNSSYSLFFGVGALLIGSAFVTRIVWSRIVLFVGHYTQKYDVELDVPALKCLAEKIPLLAFIPLIITGARIVIMTLQGSVLSSEGYGLHFSMYQMLFIIATLNLFKVLPVSLFGFGTNEVLLLALVKLWLPAYYFPEAIIAFSLSLTIFHLLIALAMSGGMSWLGKRHERINFAKKQELLESKKKQ